MAMTEAQKATLRKVRDTLRVRHLTCSRKVTGRGNNDIFVSQGMEDPGEALSLQESMVAVHMLGFATQRAALQQARAGGIIDDQQLAQNLAALNHNFSKLLAEALNCDGDDLAAFLARTGG